MTLYAAATDLTDADIVCHEGRRIVFVDPGDVPGLSLTKGAGVILPAFLLSELYRDLVAFASLERGPWTLPHQVPKCSFPLLCSTTCQPDGDRPMQRSSLIGGRLRLRATVPPAGRRRLAAAGA